MSLGPTNDELVQAALMECVREFAAYVLPDGKIVGKAWVEGDRSVVVEGLKAGRWDGSRPLVELGMVHGWSREDCEEDAARFLWRGGAGMLDVSLGNSVVPADPGHGDGVGEVESVNANGAHLEPVHEASPSPAAGYGGIGSAEQGASRQRVSYLPDIHRMLPQSEDAEKGVISSFFQSPELVGAKCVEKGVTADWFANPGRAILYEELLFMWSERMPCDFVTVANALKSRNLLEQAGGAAEITGLFNYVPTAANTTYYIGILQKHWSLRELIKVGTRSTSLAYEPMGDEEVETLLADTRRQVVDIVERRQTSGIAELLGPRRFDVAKPPKPPVEVFRIGEWTIATTGNLMAIQSKAKVGKSAWIGAMKAALMGAGPEHSLGLLASNPKGQAVIHFDTEQSPWDHHQGMLRALRRAGRPDAPAWMRSYCIADLPMKTRLNVVRQELEAAARAHGGVMAVMIDGIGDLCADPNDTKEGFALIDELHQMAIRFDTVIACVLHENPGSEIGKTRGHLGSQLERKAETNLRLEKDAEGVTVVFSDRARHGHLPKERGVKFQWSDELKMHVRTSAEFVVVGADGKKDKKGLRSNSKIAAAKARLGQFFAHGATIRRALLAAECKLHRRSFEEYWQVLRDARWIVQDKVIASMWSASPEWASELAADYPDDEEATA